MTGASGGVHELAALVSMVHCEAQDGRLDARRLTVWAEVKGVRRGMMEARRKDLIVSEWEQCDRVVSKLIDGDNQVKMMVMRSA